MLRSFMHNEPDSEAAQLGIHIAIAFLAVLVAAPPLLAAMHFVWATPNPALLILESLIFILVAWSVVRSDSINQAVGRGLLSAGAILMTFPVAVCYDALTAASGANGAAAGSLRDFLLAYDIAIGTSCLALGTTLVRRVGPNTRVVRRAFDPVPVAAIREIHAMLATTTLRAWMGSGRHWFVVANQHPARSVAWGWIEDEDARWEPIGFEGVDWEPRDFGKAIELMSIPWAIREQLPAVPPNRAAIEQDNAASAPVGRIDAPKARES